MAPSHTFTLTTSRETPESGSQGTVYNTENCKTIEHIQVINGAFM